MKILVFVVLGALLLSGCQTPITSGNAASVDLERNGILVVSTSNSGTKDDTGNVTVEFYIRPRGDRFRSFFVNTSKSLWVLSLAPGEYSISDWYMVAGQQKRGSSEISYKFTIKPGVVTYIGRLDSAVDRGKDLFGLKWVPNAEPQVVDMKFEDISHFHEEYPIWKDLIIEYQVIDGFKWKDIHTSRGSVPGL